MQTKILKQTSKEENPAVREALKGASHIAVSLKMRKVESLIDLMDLERKKRKYLLIYAVVSIHDNLENAITFQVIEESLDGEWLKAAIKEGRIYLPDAVNKVDFEILKQQ